MHNKNVPCSCSKLDNIGTTQVGHTSPSLYFIQTHDALLHNATRT
jgi:hypothetical protein